MKLNRILVVINVLLILAVGYLFYKTATPGKPKTGNAVEAVSSAFDDTSKTVIPRIAYINGDTIMEKYNFFLDMKKNLLASVDRSQGKVEQQIMKAQEEYNGLMQYAQEKGASLPQDEQQKISDRIMQLDYEIQQMKDNEEKDLYEKEMKLNESLMERITKFVTVYAGEKQIDVVFNYQHMAQVILYGNQAFDITPDVIKGLNEEYAKEKEEKKK